MENKFCKTSPCNNCPYRKDAPLQHWAIEEFKDLIEADNSMMGKSYGCHKNDGTLCTGFVMDQDKRGIPSIKLRIDFSRMGVTVADLDKLKCKSKMFGSIKEMAVANFPELKNYKP